MVGRLHILRASQTRSILSLVYESHQPPINSSIKVLCKYLLAILVFHNYLNHLRMLYAQSLRIMLATHVLPRLLAHVLAMASTQV